MITLTFDDALLNTYEEAFPILEKYGVKAVCFVPTGLFTGEIKTVRVDNAPYMSLEQLKELYRAGWEIGSHSVTHPFFEQTSLEKAALELCNSKRFLYSNGFTPTSFAFPYGYRHYTLDQVQLALCMYSWVRTVNDLETSIPAIPGFIHGIALEDYPPVETPIFHKVYVIHLVENKVKFENWISLYAEEIGVLK